MDSKGNTDTQSEDLDSNKTTSYFGIDEETVSSVFWSIFIFGILLAALAFSFGVLDPIALEEETTTGPIEDSEILTSATQTNYGTIIYFNNSFKKPTVVEVSDKEGTVIAKMLISTQYSDSISFQDSTNKSKGSTTYHVKFTHVETNEVKYDETISV